eukprot:jgi/Mesvir1/1541/Mv14524-RA.1
MELCSEVDGKREVRCSTGIIDILSDTSKTLIEVKEVSSWVHAVGQLLVYGRDYPGYRLQLHLFMTTKSPPITSEKWRSINETCKSFGIDVTLDRSVKLAPSSTFAVEDCHY